MLKLALAIAAGLAALLLLMVALRTPRDDRVWEKGLSRAPVFDDLGEGRWRLRDMRAFEFSADGPAV